MSSILEALERAEEERHTGGSPAPMPLPRVPPGRRLNLLVPGLLLSILLLSGLAFWFFHPPAVEEARQTAPRPAIEPSPVAPVPLAPTADAAQRTPTRAGSRPGLSVREELKRTTPPSARPLISEAVVAGPGPAERAPAQLPPASSGKAQVAQVVEPKMTQAPPAPAVPVPQPVPTPPLAKPPAVSSAAVPEAVVPPQRVALAPPGEEPRPAAPDIPLVWELPYSLREKILQLKSSVHVYSDLPEERFVIIDMHRYGEGDSLPPDGFRLKSIERDGMIIDYGEGLVRLERR